MSTGSRRVVFAGRFVGCDTSVYKGLGTFTTSSTPHIPVTTRREYFFQPRCSSTKLLRYLLDNMLDARGIVDIVEIIVYIPLVALCIKLLSKFGFKREGWIFLLLLAISMRIIFAGGKRANSRPVRIAGGITGAIAEQQSKPSTTLEIVAVVLQTAGISPLLTASLGFLGTV